MSGRRRKIYQPWIAWRNSMNKKYVDDYGKVWEVVKLAIGKRGPILVLWNKETGYGLWDGGKGLIQIAE